MSGIIYERGKLICFILFLFPMSGTGASLSYPDSINGYFKWQPENVTNDKLYCWTECKTSAYPQKCCACNSKLFYEFPQYTKCSEDLDIEYTTRRGRSAAIPRNSGRRDCFNKIIHRQGYLSTTPGNVCNFENITLLDLSYNFISTVGNLSCLKSLDELKLNNNRLQYIYNNTFSNLTSLRTLDLSENLIHEVEPYAFTDAKLSMLYINVARNQLRKVDATNVIFTKPFCEMNYRNNKIRKVVNDGGFVLNADTPWFAGGLVDFTGNGLEEISKLTNLISELPLLGKFFNFVFDIRGLNLTCDCTIAKLVSMFGDILRLEKREYFNITCSHPAHMAGMSVEELVLGGHMDMFVCDITKEHGCPESCNCFEQTSRNRTVVDCQNHNLQEFPKHIPRKENIELLLSNNSITTIPNRDYLGKLTKLDLSYNTLTEITEESMLKLSNVVKLNITGNSNTLIIPKSLIHFSPCQVDFRNISLQCNCDSLWLKNWYSRLCPFHEHEVKCINDGNVFPASEVSAEILDCNVNSSSTSTILGIVFLSLSVTVAVTIACFRYFRFEIVIIKRDLFTKKAKIRDTFEYDAYISFNDENGVIVQYIRTILTPTLESCNYKLFIPPRDLQPGEFREEQILNIMSRSKNFIFILSECFLNSELPWLRMESKYAWTFFKTQKGRNMIIVNFDHLESQEVNEQPFKAFLRLGRDKPFSGANPNIIKQIKSELGLPENTLS